MAYIVNRSDGTVVATVSDGTIDTTSTSITLLGKGFNNYGEIVAEDWVHMLENFANSTEPANAMQGQLWYDSSENALKMNTSDTFGSPNWVTISGAIVQSVEPTDGFGIGSFWYDNSTQTLYISADGTTWTPVNKQQTSPTQPSGAHEGDLWYDTVRKQLKVWNLNLHGSGNPGFDVVGPGRYSGSTPPNDSFLADGDEWWNATTKQLFIWDSSNAKFRLIGPAAPSIPGTPIDVPSTDANIYDNIDGNDVILVKIGDDIVGIWSKLDFTPTAINYNTVNAKLYTYYGSTTPAAGDIPLRRGLNLAIKNGPSSEATVLKGLAIKSQYADVAERYAVDNRVEPGDLVSLGGEAEICKTSVMFDSNIFGVISTQPALMLNEMAGNNDTHPFVAMTGRIPCKVVGPVRKGDRLVSSFIPGVAMAVRNLDEAKANVFSIFGRALETNDSPDVKLVEVVVGTK